MEYEKEREMEVGFTEILVYKHQDMLNTKEAIYGILKILEDVFIWIV